MSICGGQDRQGSGRGGRHDDHHDDSQRAWCLRSFRARGRRRSCGRDADSDGNPDTCPHGIFDGTHRIVLGTWDNDPTTVPETDNTSVQRAVTLSDAGILTFSGRNFALSVGDAYLVEMAPNQSPVLWDPPVAGCRIGSPGRDTPDLPQPRLPIGRR